ncbi:hypothetical protein [Winogradskyella sp.]|uniref:hypothetical protein n=1 Tax=Winogradskyella sp. TaxID=1883156 RepID=UPI003BA9AD1B
MNLELLNQLSPAFSVKLLYLDKDLSELDDYHSQIWNAKTLALARDINQKALDFIINNRPKSKKSLISKDDMTIIYSGLIDIDNPNDEDTSIAVDAYETALESNNIHRNYIHVTAISLKEYKVASWVRGKDFRTSDVSKNSSFVDRINRLVILCLYPPYLFIFSDKSRLADAIRDDIIEKSSDILTLPFFSVKDTLLEYAFANGEAYQIWMKGLHRSIVSKPDAKNLIGQDLRQALDPLGDQSFTYTSILSKLGESSTSNKVLKDFLRLQNRKSFSIGFSKGKKNIWMTKCRDLYDFVNRVRLLVKLLTNVDPQYSAMANLNQRLEDLKEMREGLNFLSIPVSTAELENVKTPFEISYNSDFAEVFTGHNELRMDMEEWIRNGELVLNKSQASEFSWGVDVIFDGQQVADFNLSIKKSDEERLMSEIQDLTIAEDINEALYEGYEIFERVIDYLRHKGPFTVRFESGHVLQGNNLYKPNYNDVFYNLKGWEFFKLKDWDVDKEKPKDFIKVLQSKSKTVKKINTSRSLFSYFIKHVAALVSPSSPDVEWYCMCHDGANEIADFLYIEPKNRRLDLIHVKGASSNSSTRKVSITAYEVVCQQAVKNLRHFDLDILIKERFGNILKDRDKIEEAGLFMTSSQAPDVVDANCTPFMNGLIEMHESKFPIRNKNVVVFQPHIRKTLWDQEEKKFNTTSAIDDSLRKALMLSTIIYETQIACIKQHVNFKIWGDDDE